MIEDVEIIVDENSLDISKHGSIYGEIFFKVGETCFPGPEWDDFPVVILKWWIDAWKAIWIGKSGTASEFLFMDGPVKIKIKKLNEETAALDFIRQGSKEPYVQCHIDQLKRALLVASRKVLREVNKRGWKTNDIDWLSNASRSLGSDGTSPNNRLNGRP